MKELTVTRTLNTGLCLDILMRPEVFESISEESSTFDDIKVDVLKEYWLSAQVGDQVIGCFMLESKTSNCVELHINILPEFRKEYSILANEKMFDWCKENIPGATILTQVPEMCGNVIKFLERFDFERNGKIPRAYVKNGEYHDLIILTRGI